MSSRWCLEKLAGECLQTGFERHGLPPQRAPLDTVYPLREHLNSVQRIVSGGYCEGLFPDTVCWTRLRNTWHTLGISSDTWTTSKVTEKSLHEKAGRASHIPHSQSLTGHHISTNQMFTHLLSYVSSLSTPMRSELSTRATNRWARGGTMAMKFPCLWLYELRRG